MSTIVVLVGASLKLAGCPSFVCSDVMVENSEVWVFDGEANVLTAWTLA